MDKNSKEYLFRVRHSAAHVLAQAVLKLFPKAKLGMGPTIEDGFYYDFDLSHKLTNEDLVLIEKEMQAIIEAKLPIKQVFKEEKNAVDFYKKWKQKYKLEILKDIPDRTISFFITGDSDFADVCKGPHIENTSEIGAFKLMTIAGAYWKGSEKNKMLQRIYGTAFRTTEELTEFLDNIEKAKERDHRKLNKNLKLFVTDEMVGSGLIMWKPRGAYMRYQIMKYAFETYLSSGYQPVTTPHLANLNLWKTSGHWDYYRDSMYDSFGIDDQQYTLKPMNCPFHNMIYRSEMRSYKEMPIRLTEMGTVYRFERSGTLQGLFRVRGFTQDDAHIYCREDQLEGEINRALELTFEILQTFGLENFRVTISTYGDTKKEKYLGDLKIWDWAVETLLQVVKQHDIKYDVVPGEAAFYGPKIDLLFTDSMKREHQLSTLQLDFNLPERFDLSYMGSDGQLKRPYMIHRALLGSLERFIGVLVEHYGGDVPLWLHMEKVRIIPISSKHVKYAEKIGKALAKYGIEYKIIEKDDPINGKIKQAEIEKIPYVVIVGDNECKDGTVSVRARRHGNIGLLKAREFVKQLAKEIKGKSPTSILIKKR